MKYPRKITALFLLACLLFPGALAAEDLIHVVGRGETIYSLSRFYGVNADELMRVNGITDPSKLMAGARIIIPADTSASSSSTSNTTANTSQQAAAQQAAAQQTTTLVDYRAVRGDTLYGIARDNGITLQNLLELNRLSSSYVLRTGDIIKVPSQAAAQNARPATNVPSANATTTRSGLYALRWPVSPKEINYMTGQMGVVVEGTQFESVLSLTHGSVVSAGPWRKFGRVVIIETNEGYYYMYGGCEAISVNAGDRVTPGMELGRLGINTVSEKPQLFFMVFRNDIPIDPALAPRTGTVLSGIN